MLLCVFINLVGSLIALLVAWLFGLLVDFLVGWLCGWLDWRVSRLAVGLFVFLPSQYICLFVRLLVLFGWLVGRLAGRMLTCLVGRPVS